MIFFKRLLAAAIGGAIGLIGGGVFINNPTIMIILGIIGLIFGWNIPSAAADKIVSETVESLAGPKRNPIKTILLWLLMLIILSLGLIAISKT